MYNRKLIPFPFPPFFSRPRSLATCTLILGKQRKEKKRGGGGWKILTSKRGEIKEVSTKVGDLRKGGLYVLLEILHGHGGKVKDLVLHKDVSTSAFRDVLVWRVTNISHDSLDLVQNLKKIKYCVLLFFFKLNFFFFDKIEFVIPEVSSEKQ